VERVPHELVADDGRFAGNDIHHAARRDLADNAGDDCARHRRGRRWLDDDGAAGRERWPKLPRHQRDG